MARPKIICPVCSQDINPGDKFCTSCGTALEWGEGSAAASPAAGGTVRCPLCGNENPPGTVDCTSCGASLAARPKQAAGQPARSAAAAGQRANPGAGIQSWKLTAGIALVLALVFAGILFFRNVQPADEHQHDQQTPQGMNQQAQQEHAAALSKEIDELQNKVNANPSDAASTLLLANRLQDARMADRAAETYKQYLALKPDDADATVDLGVCYYDMASNDTTRQAEHFQLAQQYFQAALKLNPRHQLAQFNLGIVNLMQGDMPSASEWFKKAAAVDTTTETGQRALNLLRQHSFTK